MAAHDNSTGKHDDLLVPLADRGTIAKEVTESLGKHLVPRSFRRGQLLWSEGDSDGMLVVLKTGRVKIYRLLPNGKAITMYVFGAGTLFGFMPFLDDGPYPAYAQALEDCEALVMHRSSLREVIAKDPDVAMYLVRHLARRLREAFDQIERLSTRGTLPKVAAALEALIPDDKPDDHLTVIMLPFPANEFAQSLGITPESFSRSVTHLIEQGIIKRLKKNKFQILNRRQLQKAAGVSGW
ncbi:MAG: Crp/Fnr family transcriptional regulator [Candidatus Zixiibacteriota bacterium]|nr:MAG: Crp/Fnr family transcriptional regulator [candidate division Zixibacteria bacterium]